MKNFALFLAAFLLLSSEAQALSCSGYPNPIACASALGQVDPRNFGAKCGGATFTAAGVPTRTIPGEDDTAAFVNAQYVAAASGAAVMVPDGCWVQNLPMISGVSLVAQNWAPNYGYDQGTGGIGYTLSIVAGRGYTNGTYLLQVSGTQNPTAGLSCSVAGGSDNCFNLGAKVIVSTTSNTIGTGAKTFTTSSRPTPQTAGTPIIVYDTTSVSNGTAANYVFGTVTSDSGTSMVINVTQTAGSGTITTWQISKANWITVSGGGFSTANSTGYNVVQPGTGYLATPAPTFPLPAGTGAGSGGSINAYVRNSSQPLAKPVMYIIGNPTFGINVNGSETVSFAGFEVNGFNAGNSGSCIGDDSASQGFGGKIWLYQMSLKGCATGFKGSNSCFDYLVSQNTDFAANTIGIGGCFSDFLTQGDTFTSGSIGIQGSGGGFARVANDRFEYLGIGIQSTSSSPFLEWEISGTQFDHFSTCAIDLGSTWNQVEMTGGALKAGGLAGSFTITGSATDPNGSGAIELTVVSGNTSLNGSGTNTSGNTSTTLGTSTSTVTFATGSRTFTTSVAFNLSAGAPIRIFPTGSPNTWMYGTVTSDSGTALVVNVTQVSSGSGTQPWTLVTPPMINVARVGGTTEANGTWPMMNYDGNNIVLLGSTWSNAWTSVGYGGVRGHDSDICMAGTSPGQRANQLTLSNVGFFTTGTNGGNVIAPAYVIESNTAGGSNGDYIGATGSSAIRAGTTNVANNYSSFSIGFENWVQAPPTHYVRNLLGLPALVMPEIAGGAKFTASGCTNSATLGGSSAGQFTSGTTGTCAVTITITDALQFPAPNGWVCYGYDLTSGVAMVQTASTTTTATLSGASTSGDIHNFSCMGY